jgi:cytidylate kinase
MMVAVKGRLRGVVAMDGPSGTGKSTAARRLARECGAAYLDTGAMYRAATLAVLRAGLDGDSDPTAVLAVARAAHIDSVTDPAAPAILLDGEDVEAQIRSTEVTSLVSAVSADPALRAEVVEQQRARIAAGVADRGGIVVEGRDIGTVVAPDAALKVYLTASDEIRAARRGAQDRKAGGSPTPPRCSPRSAAATTSTRRARRPRSPPLPTRSCSTPTTSPSTPCSTSCAGWWPSAAW